MKILHYFLGFPPYRSGGLTKFALDLMKIQVKDGNCIMALWPGQIKRYDGKPYIKRNKKISGIYSFELINPLPVSLDEGIKDFEAYVRKCDISVYIDFFKRVKPDIIHIHSLMGIHKEFFYAANLLNIKTIFSSHDYFGLCPKVTFYNNGDCCNDDNNCIRCVKCNNNALSLKKIKLLQSPFYRWVKNSCIMKLIRRNHRRKFFEEENELKEVDKCKNICDLANQYKNLRRYYVEIYEMIDFIHFNSTLAECIYKKYIKPKNCKVISISHGNISNNNTMEHSKSDKLRLYCLSPAKPFKGWGVLKEACDELWKEGFKNFELNIFSPITNPSEYMIVHKNGYKNEELSTILKNADVVIAPSITYETFGFTVLESLSYGVPVIVSNHVGAKDIIKDDGIVFESSNIEDLKSAIISIKKYKVKNNVKILEDFKKEIYRIYEDIK